MYLHYLSLNHRVSIDGKSPYKESYTVNSHWKMFGQSHNHRVGIKRKSPYKESYTVNCHWKSFDDVMGDVRACVRFQNSR